LLESWRMPAFVCQAVRYQLSPDLAPEAHRPFADLIAFSAAMSRLLEARAMPSQAAAELAEHPSRARLGVKLHGLQALAMEVASEGRELQQALEYVPSRSRLVRDRKR
ncbi:MAG: hypothetical protein JSV80_05275, partial [Acidobacteriota bacterium]